MSSTAVAFFVSPHGFGHAARTAALIEALGESHPDLRAEIFTAVPRWFFADSLAAGRFGWHRVVTDVGMAQRSAVEEDPAATADRLAGFFPFAPGTVEALASRVLELGCRAVVADISPLGIEVARRAGVPSVLVENFTWDWIYRAYTGREPRLTGYADAFERIFDAATVRIQAQPFCRRVEGSVEVPALARRARSGRAAVAAALDLDASRPIVLLNMGGFGWSWADAELSRIPPGLEIVALGGVERPVREGRVLRLPHRPRVYVRDLMAAADVVVGKLGYSTVAEAAVSATRLLYVRRPASPEFPVLARYVAERLPSSEISVEQLASGLWCERLEALLERPRPEPQPNGDKVAAREVARRALAVAGSAAARA